MPASRDTRARRLLVLPSVLLLTLVPLLAALGPSAASAGSAGVDHACCDRFGTSVEPDSPDAGQPLASLWYTDVGYPDADADGEHDVDEPTYHDLDGSQDVSVGDLRLTDGAGTRVLHGDAGIGAPLDVRAPAYGFVDEDGSGVRGTGDLVVLDLDLDAQVSPGDVRIAGPAAGSTVQAGDGDVGEPVFGLSTSFGWLDSDGDAWLDFSEPIYLLTGFGQMTRAGTIRLGAVPTAIEASPLATLGPAPSTTAPTLQARLTEAVSGDPVRGQLVTFSADDRILCTAVTNASGVAACGSTAALALAAANGGYTASFEGVGVLCGSQASGPVVDAPGL